LRKWLFGGKGTLVFISKGEPGGEGIDRAATWG